MYTNVSYPNGQVKIEQAGMVIMLSVDELKTIIANAQIKQQSGISDAPKIDNVEWSISKKPNRIGIKTPYNADFVRELKAATPTARWERSCGKWFFDAVAKAQVYALTERYFGGENKRYRMEFELTGCGISIDGNELISYHRDGWNWDRRNISNMVVIAADFKTGGSRRNPDINGKCVIELAVRDNANIQPAPAKMEVVS